MLSNVNNKWYRGHATSLSNENLKNKILHDTISIICRECTSQSNEKRHCKLNQVRCKLKQFTIETDVNRFSCNVNSIS